MLEFIGKFVFEILPRLVLPALGLMRIIQIIKTGDASIGSDPFRREDDPFLFWSFIIFISVPVECFFIYLIFYGPP